MPKDKDGNEIPETIEVDVHGGKVTVAKDIGERMIAARDADKKRTKEISDELARVRATLEEEKKRLDQAEQDKAAKELASKGEVEKLKELLTKENKATVEKLASKYRDTHLEAMVARSGNFVKSKDAAENQRNISLAVQLLKASCTFDLAQDTLLVIDSAGRPVLGTDGKPKTADAFVSEFIESTPIFKQPTQGQGSGAAGGGGVPHQGTITRTQYDPKNAEQARALASGKLKIAG